MDNRASIAIFQQSTETEDQTKPITPDEVFLAAKEVQETKGIKIVRNRMGVFVVSYSETGPFSEKEFAADWIPVQILVLKQWASGGIKKTEMEDFDSNSK